MRFGGELTLIYCSELLTKRDSYFMLNKRINI